MEDAAGGQHLYQRPVTHVIPQDELAAYERVADDLNRSDVQVAFVQHEFGIFGGDSGALPACAAAPPAHADRDDASYRA